ncbi:kinase-like domain-containing protein [Gigaspora rosea]|uniref:Kinase-like domain-containing protein n=1 Tax=Gigaspora rosea TaxID=44941 RepID=A0A397V2A9_9GLOM|nr:kinase-like domain-containing protein [Gigaspora rosea]
MVYSANFKGKMYALKDPNINLIMDQKIFKKFTRELENLYDIDHPNIIKFYGISRVYLSLAPLDHFMIVLQFANGGNLQKYLETKHNNGLYKISWIELMRIAKEITDGLKHLHENNIIHLDLSSKNILINYSKALIADFGISKCLEDDTSSDSNTLGMVAYVDPQYLKKGNKYKRNEKSDIYSLGVLFWEITSGIPPFKTLNHMEIMVKIYNNKREEFIADTPAGYKDLYMKCWSSNPDQRPLSHEVFEELKKLSTEIAIESIVNIVANQTFE